MYIVTCTYDFDIVPSFKGYEIAKDMCLEFLEAFKVSQPNIFKDRELLVNVVRTALRTKLSIELADSMSESVVSAVKAIAEPNIPIDLHMVEIMTIQNRMASDSRFVNGLVLDHGNSSCSNSTFS